MPNKNILLIEPGYKNKYPPLGLMKIAQYHGEDGKNDNIKFVKGTDDKSIIDTSWDRIYVTTLFSFEWNKTEKAIDYALQASHDQPSKVFVGGISASLMHDEYLAQQKWRGIRFIKGLLSDAPAVSLQLDDFAEELYSDDDESTPIEDLVPDYNILDQIDYKYHVDDAYFLYASRGCVRKCKFCGVPVLEGEQKDMGPIGNTVNQVKDKYGEKKDLILMDNNVVASPRYKEIIQEIIDLGFHSGATITRNGREYARRVDFNQGVDARILCKDKMYLKEMSKIAVKPLRIAFDHGGLRKPYEQAIRYAHEFGLNELSNYMLYNFHDTPEDLYSRMKLNIDLNEELGIRIFSFPMRYQPTTLKDRSHIGENWNKYYLRSMQIILQATHGIVSGSPDFFKEAFGEDYQKYEELLLMPHDYIFNRVWFKELGGRVELEDYKAKIGKLSKTSKGNLIEFLSSFNRSEYRSNIKNVKDKKMKEILQHYLPLDQDVVQNIWNEVKTYNKQRKDNNVNLPDDERVEDAGLEDVA